MFFKQLRMRGGTLSYLIADENTKEAAVVDPGFDTDELKNLISGNALNLRYIIITHDHIDHVVGVEELKVRFGAKIVASRHSKTSVDLKLENGDRIDVGIITIEVIYTPGHSIDSICLLIQNRALLTGDTLLIGKVGNTALPGGDPKLLFNSLFDKLLLLDDDLEIYPGHDRGPRLSSTLGKEKQSNRVLSSKNFEEFASLIKPT